LVTAVEPVRPGQHRPDRRAPVRQFHGFLDFDQSRHVRKNLADEAEFEQAATVKNFATLADPRFLI
jgi:hypothetical protein